MRVTNTIMNKQGRLQFNIRAYDRKNKEWIEDPSIMPDWLNYETIDIMHGTGRVAMNNAEVFEGDLVECDFVHNCEQTIKITGKVCFYNCRFIVEASRSVYYDLSNVMNVKILGNIYDNPDKKVITI